VLSPQLNEFFGLYILIEKVLLEFSEPEHFYDNLGVVVP